MQGKETVLKNRKELEKRGRLSVQKLTSIYRRQDWKKNGDKPCEMYTLDVDERTAAKGVSEVNYPIDEVVQWIFNQKTLMKLNWQCKQEKNLYREDIGKDYHMTVNYQRYEGKWPIVSERDFISVVLLDKSKADRVVIGSINGGDLFEYPQVKGIVRAEVLFGGYIIEKIEEKSTRVTYLSSADLKGYIPQMLVNQLQKAQGAIAGRIQSKMDQDKKT